MRRKRGPAGLALVVAAALSGCAVGTSGETTSAPGGSARPTHARTGRGDRRPVDGRPGTALAALAGLAIKGRAPKTGYSREQFGDGWASVNGCDTRDRILTRDLTHRAYAPGDDCHVHSGVLDDPYVAERIDYVRGEESGVDIDHVVALSDAWQKGAQRWSRARRIAFANDPLELLAVDEHSNRSKGDGDAATWLPPSKRFRCAYVARQVAVKRRYGVWVTHAEHDAIARVLSSCRGQRLPR